MSPPPPFTDKQLAALRQSKLSGLDQRLLAHIDELERKLLARSEPSDSGPVEAMRRENEQLRTEVARLVTERAHYRVLILATKERDRYALEIYADPQVRTRLVCLPETGSNKEYERALERSDQRLPGVFQGMVYATDIRPEVETIYCPTRGEHLYAMDRIEAFKYLGKLEQAVEGVKQEPKEPF